MRALFFDNSEEFGQNGILGQAPSNSEPKQQNDFKKLKKSKVCSQCEKELANRASFCDNCGFKAEIQEEGNKEGKVGKVTEPSKGESHKNQTKKYTVSKSNLIISIILAVLHGVALVLMPLYCMGIITNFFTVLIWALIPSWIMWRIKGRRKNGGSLTFKIVLIIILLAKFGIYMMNAIGSQTDSEATFTEITENYNSPQNSAIKDTAIKDTEQQKVTLQERNTGVEIKSNMVNEKVKQEEKFIKEAEQFVITHLQELGYQADSVELFEGMSIATDYTMLVFAYQLNSFIGAYFWSPQANRYVIYDTAEDMENFRSLYEMSLEERKLKIKAEFKKIAGFEFPSE